MPRSLRLTPSRLAALLAGVLLVTLLMAGLGAGAAPAPVGNTTYFINGQETIFTYDPLGKGTAMVLPEEVFRGLGLSLSVSGRQVSLTRGGVQVVMNVGSTTAAVDGGQNVELPATPLRQSGRVYIPADALPHLGYAWTGDSTLLEIRDLTGGGFPEVANLSATEWDTLKTRHTLSTKLRLDGVYVPATVTLMTPELIRDSRFAATLVQRAQALRLAQSYTVIKVDVQNDQIKAVSFQPGQLLLVDASGRPLEYLGQKVDLQGNLDTKVGPQATKSALLVYPKLQSNAATLGFYYDAGTHWMGSITL